MKPLVLFGAKRFYHSRWFYAIDIPKTKPYDPDYQPTAEPVKFQAFSNRDSKRIEDALGKDTEKPRTINVNEDHLFQVNLEEYSLKPLYWDGPSYEVRRGMWFNEDGMPLNGELTSEIEHLREQWSNQKKDNALNEKQEEYQDTFRLKKEYKWKFVMFIDDQKTAFLLSDLYGGSLQLSLLRSTVSQLIQIGARKITRGYEESVSITEKAKELEGHVLENAIGLGKISDMITWEFSDLVKFQNTESEGKESNDMMKNEIATDYSNEESSVETSYRPVDHLVLSVHGIGQNLGKKYQYVNFAHTVNLLRNNMKELYKHDESLQKYNKDLDHSDFKKNSRIQVLPITWRHTIGFNTEATSTNEADTLPTLRDITVEGILPLRKLLSDIGLDILLYGEEFYLDRILQNVCDQLNSIFKKFKENNPDYSGRVSLLGHSLGSLVIFDLLSQTTKFPLDFEVDNFFAIGSPIGVFKLIQRTNIGSSNSEHKHQTPACKNLFNLFHPCDPIAYRMEPLIDKTAGEYEPEWIHHSGGAPDLLADKVKQLIREKEPKEEIPMPSSVLEKMIKFNYSGRVDYSYQPNLLEADIWSAIKSHVSYFEDMDTAGFVLNQILKKHTKTTDCNVRLLKRDSKDGENKTTASQTNTKSKNEGS